MWQSFYHQGPRINTKPCGKYPPPQGFVSLRASSWSTLNRKASCPFVSLRGQPSSARLRVPSCLFVVNPQPQGFVYLRGPSWLTPIAARPSRPLASLRGQNLNRKASCHFVALGGKKTPPQGQGSLGGKNKPRPKARTPLAVNPPKNMFFSMFPQFSPEIPWPPHKKPPSLQAEPQRAAPHSEARKQHFPFQPPKRTKKKGNNLKRQELEIQRPRHSHGKLLRKFPQTFLPFFLAGTAEVRTFALAKRK